MNTTTSTRRRSWRVVDIVIASVIAAACSLIFFVWNNAVYPASSAATAGFPPLGGLIGGAWLIAGPLGGLIIRKPGPPCTASWSPRSSPPCWAPASG